MSYPTQEMDMRRGSLNPTLNYYSSTNTHPIRKIAIEYILSEVVQLISSGSSFEPLLIIPSSAVVLN
jgi:hypothetical protein